MANPSDKFRHLMRAQAAPQAQPVPAQDTQGAFRVEIDAPVKEPVPLSTTPEFKGALGVFSEQGTANEARARIIGTKRGERAFNEEQLGALGTAIENSGKPFLMLGAKDFINIAEQAGLPVSQAKLLQQIQKDSLEGQLERESKQRLPEGAAQTLSLAVSTINNIDEIEDELRAGGNTLTARFTNRPLFKKIQKLRTDYLKVVSGATATDEEFQRLAAQLPNAEDVILSLGRSGKTLEEQLDDIRRLKAQITTSARLVGGEARMFKEVKEQKRKRQIDAIAIKTKFGLFKLGEGADEKFFEARTKKEADELKQMGGVRQ
jgi:hypothetical protein